jgi:hypothetical protein
MVPKVAGKGRSFVGAGLYYLHDKQAMTSERVALTHTENLPTRDPDKAIRFMAYTAMRQKEIKARAGGSARGRKCTHPVYCYSLSWEPSERPTNEEMLAAAQDTLKHLGLSRNETLFVVHRDEPHPHIHVIVNRVHPETGIAAPLPNDFLVFSRWAEDYERREGKIFCERRVENNARRRNGEFVRDRDSQNAAEFHRWRKARIDAQHDKRKQESAALDTKQKKARDRLQAERDRRLADMRAREKESTRTRWRTLYQIQRDERRQLDRAQRTVWTRLRHFLRHQGAEFRTSDWDKQKRLLTDAFAAVIGGKRQYAELERRQKRQRVFVGNALKERADRFTRQIQHDHDEKLAALRKEQEQARADLRTRQSQESQEQAREIKEGRDRALFRAQQRAREAAETKQDITRPQPPKPKQRGGALAERFNRASQQQPDAAHERGTSTSGGERSPQQDAGRERQQQAPAAKPAAFREQAEDVTKPPAAAPEKGGGSGERLADKFRRARDEKPAERTDEKGKQQDDSRDTGRERSRDRKPPGWKPD